MFATVLEFAERQPRIPPGLEEMPPGPELAAVLEGIDTRRLGVADRVTVMQAEQRLVSHYQARTYASMVSIVDHYEIDYGGEAYDAAAMEIAPALRLSRRAADLELSIAVRLDRLLDVAGLLRDGRIDRRRAATLIRGTDHLDADRAAAVIGRIVHDTPRLTAGQIAARLRKACIDADPQDAGRRYHEAVEQRRVVTEMNPDGSVHLIALDLPADRAAAAAQNVGRLARDLRRSGDTRSMDQLRADVFLDLLVADEARVSGDRGMVEVSASLETLVGLSEEAGELAGFGPVIAEIARQVTGRQRNAEWRYRIRDGCLDHTGPIRRRPTAAQARQVEARDRRCVFPGCRMPARYADIDHVVPHSRHGPTCPCNLAVLCRWHHLRRHRFGWTYRRLDTGELLWTTPLGLTYVAGARAP
jgi:hypothetical protein